MSDSFTGQMEAALEELNKETGRSTIRRLRMMKNGIQAVDEDGNPAAIDRYRFPNVVENTEDIIEESVTDVVEDVWEDNPFENY